MKQLLFSAVLLTALARPLFAADLTVGLQHGFAMSVTDITWQQFLKDCGVKAQEANKARTEKAFREKYQDKVVVWSGTVYSVDERKHGRAFSLAVAMKPTESIVGLSDILIDVPGEFKDTVLALNQGDKIRFTARITHQGGWFLHHELELIKLEQ